MYCPFFWRFFRAVGVLWGSGFGAGFVLWACTGCFSFIIVLLCRGLLDVPLPKAGRTLAPTLFDSGRSSCKSQARSEVVDFRILGAPRTGPSGNDNSHMGKLRSEGSPASPDGPLDPDPRGALRDQSGNPRFALGQWNGVELDTECAPVAQLVKDVAE